jgi:hypothetical protein
METQTVGIDRELLKRYAEIRAKIAELETMEAEAKDLILSSLKTNQFDTFKLMGVGTFSISTRTSYEYSQKVAALNEAVKDAKKAEEENGTAKKKETEYLRFQ